MQSGSCLQTIMPDTTRICFAHLLDVQNMQSEHCWHLHKSWGCPPLSDLFTSLQGSKMSLMHSTVHKNVTTIPTRKIIFTGLTAATKTKIHTCFSSGFLTAKECVNHLRDNALIGKTTSCNP